MLVGDGAGVGGSFRITAASSLSIVSVRLAAAKNIETASSIYRPFFLEEARLASMASTIFAKSDSDRVRRSTL